MLCVAERTSTPEVKKAPTFPASSHKPSGVDRPFPSNSRPLPPTPVNSISSEKSSGELMNRTVHAQRGGDVRFKVLLLLVMEIQVVRDVTPCVSQKT